jgi:hypothetical protein
MLASAKSTPHYEQGGSPKRGQRTCCPTAGPDHPAARRALAEQKEPQITLNSTYCTNTPKLQDMFVKKSNAFALT